MHKVDYVKVNGIIKCFISQFMYILWTFIPMNSSPTVKRRATTVTTIIKINKNWMYTITLQQREKFAYDLAPL